MNIRSRPLTSLPRQRVEPEESKPQDYQPIPALQFHLERALRALVRQVLPEDPQQRLHPQPRHHPLARPDARLQPHLLLRTRDLPPQKLHHARLLLRRPLRQHLHAHVQLHDLRVRRHLRALRSPRSSSSTSSRASTTKPSSSATPATTTKKKTSRTKSSPRTSCSFGSPSALFSKDLLAEDSLLNSCFSGKFLIINKCCDCQELSFGSEDFLSLNLEVFTSDQSDHIKNLRKEFGIGGEPKEKKKSWGIFKAFSSFS